MKITFLGTGTSQGIPVIGSNHPVGLSTDPKDKRLRVSVLVEWEGHSYVIDCGPDFRYQMLRANCTKINGILFTHEHSDHVAGLDDIRPFFFNQGDIPIYAHKRVLDALHRRYDYVFEIENKYPGAPTLEEHEITNVPFKLSGMKVIPILVLHDKLEVFGFRFKDFAYLTDVKTIAENELKKLEGLKVLVVNALRIKPHYSHLNLEEALAFVNRVKPEKAYLTHISHYMGFHEEVQQTLPKHVYLAYDNLQIEI